MTQRILLSLVALLMLATTAMSQLKVRPNGTTSVDSGVHLRAQGAVTHYSIGDKWYYGTERIGPDGLGRGIEVRPGEHEEVAVGVVIYEVVAATEREQGGWHYKVSRTIRDCYAQDSVALPIYMDIDPDGKVWMQEGDYPRNLVHDPNLQVGDSFRVTIRAAEGSVNPWVSRDLGKLLQVDQMVMLERLEVDEQMPHSPKVYLYHALSLEDEHWYFFNKSWYIEGIGFEEDAFYPYRGVFGNSNVVCMCFHNDTPEERLRGFVPVEGDTVLSYRWSNLSKGAPIDTVYFMPSTVANEAIVDARSFVYDAEQQRIEPLEGSTLMLYNSIGQQVAISQGETLSIAHLPAGVYIVTVHRDRQAMCRSYRIIK